MFYERLKDLPAALQCNLPTEAQEMYRQEYNAVWKKYQHIYNDIGAQSAEEVAHRKAWGKIKRSFVKQCDGSWLPRNNSQ